MSIFYLRPMTKVSMYENISIMKRIITMIISCLKHYRPPDIVRTMHKHMMPCLWQRYNFYPKCQSVVCNNINGKLELCEILYKCNVHVYKAKYYHYM